MKFKDESKVMVIGIPKFYKNSTFPKDKFAVGGASEGDGGY